jgi:hypothetical protein
MTRTGAAPGAEASGCRRPASPGWRRSFPRAPRARTLPERLRGVEPVALRQRDPPARDLLRVQLTDRSPAEGGDRLPSSQRSLSVVTGSRSCWARYTSTNSARVSDPEIRRSRCSRSSSRCNASAASRSEANPPAEPASSLGRPAVAVRPQRLSVPSRPLQPDQLALLRHRQSPLSARSVR